MDTPLPYRDLRELRDRRDVLATKIKEVRTELSIVRTAGNGGIERLALRAKLIKLRGDRDRLVAELDRAKSKLAANGRSNPNDAGTGARLAPKR